MSKDQSQELDEEEGDGAETNIGSSLISDKATGARVYVSRPKHLAIRNMRRARNVNQLWVRLASLLTRQLGNDFGERFMSNGKRNLFATMAGFLVRAEAAESCRFGSPKKNLEIGNDLLAVNGSAAPQQGLVALRIDFDHAESFQQAADPLRGAVRPSLES